MTSEPPVSGEPPQEAIETYLQAFPGQDEAAARRAWAASRQQLIASETRRRRDSTAVVTGVLIAIADNDLPRANMLIAGLSPDDLPGALRRAAGLLIDMMREGDYSNEQIRAFFADMALRQAAAED